MSGQPGEPGPEAEAHVAAMHPRPRFNLIWLIPVVAALVAAYLGWQAYHSRGPTITISFRAGDGLTAGQTRVRHKAVELGVVEQVTLSEDLSQVIARVQMRKAAVPELTDNARFWVVRPRLAGGNVSGLETLLSGAYIELDPGPATEMAAAEPRRDFTGLDEPPAVRSDEPGQIYTLRATRIGGITSGSPVLYRDVVVGEVLRWEFGPQGQGFLVTIFVRRPYDEFVHEGSQFWNSSGVAIDLGENGVQFRLDSLQALLSGAVSFDTNAEARATPVSKPGAVFRMYRDQPAAAAGGYQRRLRFLTRFEGSVRGLAVGASVNIYGITIGTVTAIKLQFDPNGLESHVDVFYEIQPERVLTSMQIDAESPLQATRNLVHRGLRMQLETANLLTGQKYLSMTFTPNVADAEVAQLPDGTIVVPSMPGGLDSLTGSVTQVAQNLAQVPFAQIAQDLDQVLRGAGAIANGPDLRRTLSALSATMTNVQEIVKKFDTGASPAFKRLPDIAADLQATLEHANTLVASVDTSYGGNSQVRRDLERLLSQVGDAARSVRVLADYLTQHPEALIQGRASRGQDR